MKNAVGWEYIAEQHRQHYIYQVRERVVSNLEAL